MTNQNGDLNKSSDLWEIVKSLQSAIGGGKAKAVRITALFDEQGRIVGKARVDVVEMYPNSLGDFLRFIFGA